jgi:hypothetical protein
VLLRGAHLYCKRKEERGIPDTMKGKGTLDKIKNKAK